MLNLRPPGPQVTEMVAAVKSEVSTQFAAVQAEMVPHRRGKGDGSTTGWLMLVDGG